MSAEPIASVLDWSQDAPGWWRNGVIDQVDIRSFRNSDGDGIGDAIALRRHVPALSPGLLRWLPPDTAGWFLLEVAR